MSSRTTPTQLQTVPGCPSTVQIYQIPASQNWQFRFFIQGRYVCRTTRCSARDEARQRAKDFYGDILLKEKLDLSIHPTSFHAVAKQFVEWQQLQVNLGRIVPRTHREDLYKLKQDVLPFFQTMDVGTINKAKIEEYLSIIAGRRLSKSTLNKHLSVIRKILRFAADRNIIKLTPSFPSIGVDNNVRPYFDLPSYQKLCRAAKVYAARVHVADYKLNGKSVRKLRYTQDFADLVQFGFHVFVRISDIKVLKHKHVKVVEEGGDCYLEIFSPHSKTASRSSCSMPLAAALYWRLLARHKAEGFGRPEDFVFYPQYPNRNYALDVVRRLFENIIDDTGLRKDEWGNSRTLYSLRHSALMFRLLHGDKIDIFLIAKNALTSVEMLEKFHLSHAESKMRIKELQSFKDEKTKISYRVRKEYEP